ncbi:MAG TPA: type II 3-dehydroquinate dehydratase [Ruminiclostridium sp.]|nr:type II 3-dehydroquinate dehydratase [Ruminiclostridium sp.]
MGLIRDKINIGIINGPNINLLGIREPGVYGNEKWNDIEERVRALAKEINAGVMFYQSNHEGAIVDFIQNNISTFDGVIINPAAYTKTGYAILDALTAVNIPYIEVHLSNIFFRGGWHTESIFSPNAVGQIIGFKGFGYELALRAISNHIINTFK